MPAGGIMKSPLVFALIALSAVAMQAQSVASIDVAAEEWEDCTYADGSGLYFETIGLVYAKQGAKVNVKIVPYARSIEMVESGKTDICLGTYAGEAKNATYPKYPLDYDDITVLIPAAKASAFKSEADLKDKKVAWIVDYGYDEQLDVPVKLTEVSNSESGIKMLQSGRIDYYIETKSDISAALEALGIPEKDFVFRTIKWIPLYACFAKNEKGAQLQAIWDRRLPELFKSGELKKLFFKWGFEESYGKLAREF
jgi:polar amino acid transport system substrate-binding protein